MCRIFVALAAAAFAFLFIQSPRAQFIEPMPKITPGSCSYHSSLVSMLARILGATIVWRGRQKQNGESIVEYELYNSDQGWALVRHYPGTTGRRAKGCVLDFGRYRTIDAERKEGRDIGCVPDLGYAAILKDLAGITLRWAGLDSRGTHMYALYVDRRGRWALRLPTLGRSSALSNDWECSAEVGYGSTEVSRF